MEETHDGIVAHALSHDQGRRRRAPRFFLLADEAIVLRPPPHRLQLRRRIRHNHNPPNPRLRITPPACKRERTMSR